MVRVIAFLIGAGLIVLGGVAFVGAVELWRAPGSEFAAVAQSFLVPGILVAVGAFVVWMGLTGRDR